MPWNDDGKDNGPWGKVPPSEQPDLDDLLKKGREKFSRMFPDGGGGSPKGALYILAAFFVMWLASGFYVIDTKEEGVILRFGEFHRSTAPGLHYHIPFPVERVEKVPVTLVNRVEVGLRSIGRGRGSGAVTEVPKESLMLTGDENIVDIHFEVQWKISDAKNFLFKVRDPESTVKSVAESAMREVIGKAPIAEALAEGKYKLQQEASALLQQTLRQYETGIEIVELQLRKVDPPAAVIDAFRDVQTAKADEERARNEAETYRNDIIPRARGKAERIIQEAEAYKREVVAQSEGQASRFEAVYNKYRVAKNVTRKRMYLETMEEVLTGMDKILIDDQKGSGVIPYLPLNEIEKKR